MIFDRYFSLPAALARHRSAPLAEERERFLTHLEATGTGRSAIHVAATYLLQVVNLLGLRRLRDVTLEEVDRAADHWNTLRNQDKQYPAGQSGVRCFAQTARRFLRFEGKLRAPRLPQPFSEYLREFVEAMSTEYGLSEATILGRRYRAANFLKWYARRHRSIRGIRLPDIDAYQFVENLIRFAILKREVARNPIFCWLLRRTKFVTVLARADSRAFFNKLLYEPEALGRPQPCHSTQRVEQLKGLLSSRREPWLVPGRDRERHSITALAA
jgi:hypothetical protein